MNRNMFAEIYFDKATLAKQATESFCAKHRILHLKWYPVILSRFVNVIVGTFYGQSRIVLRLMYQYSQRQDSFIIPIEASAFLAS